MLQNQDNKKKEINRVLDHEAKKRRKRTRKTNIKEGKGSVLTVNNVTERSTDTDQDLINTDTVQDQKITNRENRRNTSRESTDTDHRADNDSFNFIIYNYKNIKSANKR